MNYEEVVKEARKELEEENQSLKIELDKAVMLLAQIKVLLDDYERR